MPIITKSISPASNQNTFLPNSKVVFNLLEEGFNFVKGSFRISGTVKVSNGATLVTNQLIYIDGDIGAQSLFGSFLTTSLKIPQLEALNDYPRYLKLKTQGQQYKFQTGLNVKNTIELRTGNDLLTQYLLQGELTGDANPAVSQGKNTQIQANLRT